MTIALRLQAYGYLVMAVPTTRVLRPGIPLLGFPGMLNVPRDPDLLLALLTAFHEDMPRARMPARSRPGPRACTHARGPAGAYWITTTPCCGQMPR